MSEPITDARLAETTDAVAEAREMIAAFEVISNGRTRFAGQPERADEAYDRNRRALVARIEALEAMCASYAETIGECNAENSALEAKIAAVRALHNREESTTPDDPSPWCGWCGSQAEGQDWPCPTIAALDGVEAAQALLEAEK